MNNQEVQERLIAHRLLDPIADGKWGKQSALALVSFQKLHGIDSSKSNNKTFDVDTIELLRLPPAELQIASDFASKVVRYCLKRKYFLAVSTSGQRRLNIIYVEGCDSDGTLNNDAPDEFNDCRLLIEIDAINLAPKIVGAWEGTTEPGERYTYRPMNPGGAFRIAFDQFKAWQVGVHGNSEPHEALVQTGEISGYRDFNKDYKRTGDPIVRGSEFGVNQHWGYDLPKSDIGAASAGCLVGRSRNGHREFMQMLKQDARYEVNDRYTFMTSVIAGNEI